MTTSKITTEQFNQIGQNNLPGHLGMVVTHLAAGEAHIQFDIKPYLMAPNGYIHAGSLVSLADTAAGYGCMSNLPEGANSFTTVELKTNHLGSAREGTIIAVAKVFHMGRTTQVWDVTVTHVQTQKTLVLFRCTQMILYPKG